MTAESTLLPGEDASEFAARLQHLLDDLQPRNRLEEILIERINRDDWMSIRAERAAAARVALRLRHDTAEQTRAETDDAIELGHRLLHLLAFPLPITLSDGKGAVGQAPLADIPGDPHHPARLVLRLEGTLTGCDWLLDRWAGLKERLEIEGLWQTAEGFEMIRLMGRYVIDIARSHEVQFIALASSCVAETNEPEVKQPEVKQPEVEPPYWNQPYDYKPGRNQPYDYRPGRSAAFDRPDTAPRLTGADLIAHIGKRLREYCEPFTRGLAEQASISRLGARQRRGRAAAAVGGDGAGGQSSTRNPGGTRADRRARRGRGGRPAGVRDRPGGRAAAPVRPVARPAAEPHGRYIPQGPRDLPGRHTRPGRL